MYLYFPIWILHDKYQTNLITFHSPDDPVKRTLWAAETGHVDVLRDMLAVDAELVHCQDQDGYQPLHRASYENHTDVMELLLKSSANVNGLTHDGWTPLHSASRWGQTQAASLLLQNGADINRRTNGGLTPLHLAACNAETKDILELLLTQEDIDISLVNKLGETARQLCERANPFSYLFDLRSEAVNVLGHKSWQQSGYMWLILPDLSELTHRGHVTHICVSKVKLSHRLFR